MFPVFLKIDDITAGQSKNGIEKLWPCQMMIRSQYAKLITVVVALVV